MIMVMVVVMMMIFNKLLVRQMLQEWEKVKESCWEEIYVPA